MSGEPTMEPTTTPKPFVFVVMPFEKDFDDTYKLGIKPACTEAGTYCERLDEQIFEEGMLDRIYNQIAKADIVVADMSGQNANVFYEVGYGHALGKRVILVTNDATDIPFDLKHRFHIVYDSISKLKEKLFERVSWYVAHPEDNKVAVGETAQFYFRGELLDPEKEFKARYRGNVGEASFYIELAVHNPNGAAFTEFLFTPALISPAEFEECVDTNSGISISSLALPDGRRLHQYDTPVAVQPGGWQKIPFGLPLLSPLGKRHRLTLRILGNGPQREIDFTILTTDQMGNVPPIKL